MVFLLLILTFFKFVFYYIIKVATLYRHSLKSLASWAVDRDVFNDSATQIRARFDENRSVNPAAASRLLKVRYVLMIDFYFLPCVFVLPCGV